MLWTARRRLLLGLSGLAAAPALARAADEGGGRGRRRASAAEAMPAPAYDLERGLPAARRTVEVADGAELARALARARPGDHLVLADGEYASPGGEGFAVLEGGSPEAPVVVRAARPGAASLRSPVLVEADYACLAGLDLAAEDAVTIHGDHNAVLRCRFHQLTGVLMRRGASHNRIGWNSFADLPYFKDERKSAVRVDPRPRDPRPVVGNRIYRNYFSTNFEVEEKGRNEVPCIYVGLSKSLTDDLPPSGTLVEHNLFDRIDYKSAVRIKSHGCTVRHNTAIGPGADSGRRNRAQFAQRQGHGNRWHANWAEATTGFKLNGHGQELLGNVARKGASIDLNCGSEKNKTACSYSLFVANEGPCEVGNRDFKEPVAEMCESNWFEAHEPDADAINLTEFQEGTSVTKGTEREGLPRATKLTAKDVGADAADAPEWA